MTGNVYVYFDGILEGVEGEIPIYRELKEDGTLILVTEQPTDSNGENYFNVYFVDPMFKEEPLNNLNEQIPKENKPKDWQKYLKLRWIEYKAWRDDDLYISVTVEEEEE